MRDTFPASDCGSHTLSSNKESLRTSTARSVGADKAQERPAKCRNESAVPCGSWSVWPCFPPPRPGREGSQQSPKEGSQPTRTLPPELTRAGSAAACLPCGGKPYFAAPACRGSPSPGNDPTHPGGLPARPSAAVTSIFSQRAAT